MGNITCGFWRFRLCITADEFSKFMTNFEQWEFYFESYSMERKKQTAEIL